jgi:hypothetical protein
VPAAVLSEEKHQRRVSARKKRLNQLPVPVNFAQRIHNVHHPVPIMQFDLCLQHRIQVEIKLAH